MEYRRRTVAVTALTVGLAIAAAGPATAREDPGPPSPGASWGCALERVGAQLIRCDDLTGGNVTAPTWIPERT